MSLLFGLSGCKLEIVSKGMVRKTSPSVAYNDRLARQANKQDLFSNFVFRNITVPDVVGTGVCGDKFFFDMKYVSGASFTDYFSVCSMQDLDFIAQTLVGYLRVLESSSRMVNVSGKVAKKLNDLLPKTKHPEYVKFALDSLQQTDTMIPQGFCHGDLTFSNIMFHKNRLCFIDFLDSYIDSFYCDLAKLKQDLFYLWTPRLNQVASVRLVQAYGYVWRHIHECFKSVLDSKLFAIIDAVNILRIEPYLNPKHENFFEFVLNSSALYNSDEFRSKI